MSAQLVALVRAFLADYPPATCHPCAESRRLARGRPSPQAVEAGRRLDELVAALEAAEAAGAGNDVRSRALEPQEPKSAPLFPGYRAETRVFIRKPKDGEK